MINLIERDQIVKLIIQNSDLNCILKPLQRCRFGLFVKDENDQPVANLKLRASLHESCFAQLKNSHIVTGPNGETEIELIAGNESERFTLNVEGSQVVWKKECYVTDVKIQVPMGFQLADFQETLLKMLFWDKTELQVIREFGGGLSGSRVLQVQAKDDQGVYLTQVVKIGQKDEMKHEKESYQHFFKNRLPNAAPVADYCAFGHYAAIIYGDATAAKSLKPVLPFMDYFFERDSFEISPSLYAILKKGLSRIYRYYTVRNESYRKLLGKYFPENLVVSLKGSEPPLGVFPVDQKVEIIKDIKVLKQVDVERFNFELSPGEFVFLKDFPVSKMQDGDLNLEDENKENYKVKVKYDGKDVTTCSTGDHVNVVAQFIIDRNTRLEFAVRHCLENFGYMKNKYGYAFDKEIFPDPIEVFNREVDKNCDIAWGTIHGDLHWDNIMLENPSNWWLIDYGLSGKGPILYDFVKLELYLRYKMILKMKNFSPALLINFEKELVENPLGELPIKNFGHYQLEKAVTVIQTIRRFALPYIIGDFYDYLRMLFIYAMAMGKYYPTKDKWEAVSDNAGAEKKLEKTRFQFFTVLSTALAIARVLKWKDLSSERSQKRYEFLPLGAIADPEPKKIKLDVGNKCVPGVIDHHLNANDRDPKLADILSGSSASILWNRPDFINNHVADLPAEEVTLVVHEHPDFDCVVAAYLTWYLLKLGYFPAGSFQLIDYANEVDRGAEFLEMIPFPERSPYALFEFSLKSVPFFKDAKKTYEKQMEIGFELINYFIDTEILGIHSFYKNILPKDHEFWQTLINIGADQQRFREKDERMGEKITTKIRIDGQIKKVPGIVLRSPQSYFFKAWARKAGYKVMVVCWPQPDKPDDRIVISVPPYLKFGLKGLGKELEKAETAKRKKLKKQRPKVGKAEARWKDVDNADPWYDGRSPIHAYTIVDSPRMGTVMTVEEVVHILEKGKWTK